jgi:hypothetical protein
MSSIDLKQITLEFQSNYDEKAKDDIWKEHSHQFRRFWKDKILAESKDPISDDDCDAIIRILDRNGKGNTKQSVAVARAMIPQGAWRRMLNEFHSNRELGLVMTSIFEATDAHDRADAIDKLYKINEGRKNNLTGPSGNAVGAFLAANDPFNILSVISLKDRRTLIEFLSLPVSFDWGNASIGQRIVISNQVLLDGLRKLGLAGSAQTASVFCYFSPMKALWKGEHTVKRTDKSISVTVPGPVDAEDTGESATEESGAEEIRESMQIQALIAKIGTSMGFAIWLPRADRGRVLKAWSPEKGELLDDLPLGYDSTTLKTIEQIDVLWLRRRTIVRAFEIEHTTSVYSGLLRMADLVALQPNINIKLHIVAPELKHDKVMQEIQRPVFALLEGRPLSEMCTFLSYDSIKQIAESKHLAHLSDSVIEDYEQKAD